MKSSLNEILKIFSLSLHLMYVHKFLAFMIAGTGWENRFSNLHHLETNICLILLLLTGHLSSQPSGSESHGLWVMAALSRPRLFAAWRVEAPLFAVSLCGGPCNLRSIWLDA